MSHMNLLHKAMSKIDWDFVVQCFRKLDLKWYDENHIPTKEEIVSDLVEIATATLDEFTSKQKQTHQSITLNWAISVDDIPDEGVFLEILFVPTMAFVSTDDNYMTEELEFNKTEDRLTVAVGNENYELAEILRKKLDDMKIALREKYK